MSHSPSRFGLIPLRDNQLRIGASTNKLLQVDLLTVPGADLSHTQKQFVFAFKSFQRSELHLITDKVGAATGAYGVVITLADVLVRCDPEWLGILSKGASLKIIVVIVNVFLWKIVSEVEKCYLGSGF